MGKSLDRHLAPPPQWGVQLGQQKRTFEYFFSYSSYRYCFLFLFIFFKNFRFLFFYYFILIYIILFFCIGVVFSRLELTNIRTTGLKTLYRLFCHLPSKPKTRTVCIAHSPVPRPTHMVPSMYLPIKTLKGIFYFLRPIFTSWSALLRLYEFSV